MKRPIAIAVSLALLIPLINVFGDIDERPTPTASATIRKDIIGTIRADAAAVKAKAKETLDRLKADKRTTATRIKEVTQTRDVSLKTARQQYLDATKKAREQYQASLKAAQDAYDAAKKAAQDAFKASLPTPTPSVSSTP